MTDRSSQTAGTFSLIRRLWALSGTLLLMLVALGIVSTIKASQLLKYLDRVSDIELPAVRNMTLVDMMHDGLRAVVMEALYSTEAKDHERVEQLAHELTEKSKNLRLYLANISTLPLSNDAVAAIRTARPKIDSYVEAADRIIIHARQGDMSHARAALPAFRKSFELLETELETLGQLIEKEAGTVQDQGRDSIVVTRWITGVGLVFGVLFSAWVTRTLTLGLGGMTQKILDAGNSVETTSGTLETTSLKLSEGATQAAASIEETLSTLEKVSELSKSNSQAAVDAEKEARESRSVADHAESELRGLKSSIAEISAGSRKIAEIVRVIDDIAFQTNLLALNAAVEAARAGEQGRGFAVVADAVRTLAQRSGEAAKNISEMIAGTTQTVEEGRKNAERTTQVLLKIVESIKKMAELNVTIARGSEEQADGVSRISAAMSQLAQASKTNAHTATDLNGCTAGLIEQSQQFELLAEEIHVWIHGSKHAA